MPVSTSACHGGEDGFTSGSRPRSGRTLNSIAHVSHDLERFVTAQNSQQTYEHALTELRAGRKTGHWMWFVFPQLAGLGRSAMARTYAIANLHEAQAYLQHPVLGPRLVTAAECVLTHRDRSAEEILGDIDAVKLRSSMTLFTQADPGETIFHSVLDQFFDGEEDQATLDRL